LESKEPEDMIPMTVSKEDYQMHWKRSREGMSSSMSGLHFRHWKAAAESDMLFGNSCHVHGNNGINQTFTKTVAARAFSDARESSGV